MTTPTSSSGPGAPPPPLISALRRLLRPLVRLLLANGVTYPFLANLLKSVFVEVAERDFRLEGRRQTDSRINLLTGVHRKDVRRLRQQQATAEPVPPAVSLGAQLVARWTAMPPYLDEQGQPRPLPRLTSEGGDVSFEALVESVNKDIRSRVVLDEWLRLGIAQLDDDDRVRLNVAAFVPERGFDEKAYYLGRNVHDHLAAAAHNLAGERPPFLERSVYYDGLTTASAAALAELARELGMQSLQAVNRRALELQERDRQDPAAKRRMNFGIYYYSADETEDKD
jgi:hypothetical protein